MVWGGKWERGSELGTRVHPWQIHADVWQNQQYCKVKKKNQIKYEKKREGKKKVCKQLNSNNQDNHVSLEGDSFLAEHSVDTLSLAITYI